MQGYREERPLVITLKVLVMVLSAGSLKTLTAFHEIAGLLLTCAVSVTVFMLFHLSRKQWGLSLSKVCLGLLTLAVCKSDSSRLKTSKTSFNKDQPR